MDAPHACYPGSFDPVTFGHLDLIRRGAVLFGKLTVAVGRNVTKRPLFDADERVAMIREQVGDLANVEVVAFRGLVVEFCRERNISVMLRGLRTVSDFESEFQMAMTNRKLNPAVETVMVMPDARYAFISSRLIKEVMDAGGSVDDFLPPAVATALGARLAARRAAGS